MKRMAAVFSTGFAILASAPAAHAAIVVTPFNGIDGAAPTAAPNCYSASQVYTGKATCFGGTYMGGNSNGGGYGTLYQIKPNGKGRSTVYSFDVLNGLTPSQSPILLSDKQTLAFTTSQGGDAGSGVIGTFDLKTKQVKVLASFTGPGGSTPQAPPIQVGNTLYGVAGQGGAHGYGVIWSLSLSGASGVKVLHSFVGGKSDVATPFGALTYNPADGLLYGMAFAQAANSMGGIFSIKPSGADYKLRTSLTPTTGGVPQMGALVLSNGIFYGNGWMGGSKGLGTVFSFNPATNQTTALWNYTKKTGSQPYNSLAVSKSGKWLYAVTWQNGSAKQGTIVALAKDGSTWKLLKTLDSTTGGQSSAGASLSPNGKRLITGLSSGGANHVGTTLSLPIPADYR